MKIEKTKMMARLLERRKRSFSFILFGEGILRTEHFAFDVIHEEEKDRQGHDDNIKHETKSQLET